MQLHSNWNKIAERSALDYSSPKPLRGTAKITVRLLHVRMRFESDNKYTRSKTTAVHVSRDPEDGDLTLSYIYKADTPTPVETDSGSHYGSATLRFVPKGEGGPKFDGWYWTNRNWEKGLNTAGTAVLLPEKDPCSGP